MPPAARSSRRRSITTSNTNTKVGFDLEKISYHFDNGVVVEDRHSMYLDGEDYERIKAEISVAIYELKKKNSNHNPNYNASLEGTELQQQLEEEEQHSLRGLEYKTKKASKFHRSHQRRRSIKAVIKEQLRLKEYGEDENYDVSSDLIAEVYKGYSQQSLLIATRFGLLDAYTAGHNPEDDDQRFHGYGGSNHSSNNNNNNENSSYSSYQWAGDGGGSTPQFTSKSLGTFLAPPHRQARRRSSCGSTCSESSMASSTYSSDTSSFNDEDWIETKANKIDGLSFRMKQGEHLRL